MLNSQGPRANSARSKCQFGCRSRSLRRHIPAPRETSYKRFPHRPEADSAPLALRFPCMASSSGPEESDGLGCWQYRQGSREGWHRRSGSLDHKSNRQLLRIGIALSATAFVSLRAKAVDWLSCPPKTRPRAPIVPDDLAIATCSMAHCPEADLPKVAHEPEAATTRRPLTAQAETAPRSSPPGPPPGSASLPAR